MSQQVEATLMEHDRRLIEVYRLGSPQSVFRKKEMYVRFFDRAKRGLILFVACSLCILLWGAVRSLIWPSQSYVEVDPLLIVMPLLGLVVAIFLAQKGAKDIREDHIIVCEHGLLLLQSASNQQPKGIQWGDIERMTENVGIGFRRTYTMQVREGKEVKLDATYQDLDALVAEIRQHRNG